MILTIAAHKGGVGKTTTAAAIAQALRAKSKRNKVLLIDTDNQRSASTIYKASEEAPGLYEVIRGAARASEAIQSTPAGEIIPGSRKLYALDAELSDEAGRDFFLRKALEEIRGEYTHIVIDTAPGRGTCLIQSLVAADGVLIPIQCNAQAFNGVNQTIDTIERVKTYCNEDLKLYGLLITRYQPRTNLARQYEGLIEKEAKAKGTKVIKTRIRQGVAIEEAQALRKDLYNYAPKSKPAEDYMQLVKELKL